MSLTEQGAEHPRSNVVSRSTVEFSVTTAAGREVSFTSSPGLRTGAAPGDGCEEIPLSERHTSQRGRRRGECRSDGDQVQRSLSHVRTGGLERRSHSRPDLSKAFEPGSRPSQDVSFDASLPGIRQRGRPTIPRSPKGAANSYRVSLRRRTRTESGSSRPETGKTQIRRIDTAHQYLANPVAGPCPSPSRRRLQSRVPPVKSQATRPSSRASCKSERPATRQRPHLDGRFLETADTRKDPTGPEVSPFLHHWRAQKNTGLVKSSPSLPVLVSTTVAASKRKPSRNSSSLSRDYAGTSSSSPRGDSPNAGAAADNPMRSPSRVVQHASPATREESPVRERINMFEQLSRSTSSVASGKDKSYEADSMKRPVGKRTSSWQPRAIVQALRARSFSGRKENRSPSHKANNGIEETSNNKSKIPRFRRNNHGNPGQMTGESRPSSTPKLESSLARPRRWKVPKSGSRPEESVTVQDPQGPSHNFDGKNVTAQPRFFRSTRTISGRFLPSLKGHGPKCDTEIRNDSAPADASPTTAKTGPTSKPSTPLGRISHAPCRQTPSPAAAGQKPRAPRPRPGYSAPFRGRFAGPLPKSGAVPVLSPAPAHAQKMARRSDTGPATATRHFSLSWGRRAAAAALDIGRRIKARKASESSSLSSTTSAVSSLAGTAVTDGGGTLRTRAGGAGTNGGDGGGTGDAMARYHEE